MEILSKVILLLVILLLVLMVVVLPLLRLLWGYIKNLFFKTKHEKWKLNDPFHLKKVERTEKKRLSYLRTLGEHREPYLYLGKNASKYAVLHNIENPSYNLLKTITRWIFYWDVIEFSIKISDENRF
ncbi:hypothetical protein [Streptococcus suis]